MRVAVTSASGFVGLNIVEHLLNRGDTVVSLSRHPIPRAAECRFSAMAGAYNSVRWGCLGCEPGAGRASRSANDARGARGGADAGGAARARKPRAHCPRQRSGDAERIARSGARRRGAVRLYLSSAAVYGPDQPGTAAIEEDTPPHPVSSYGITKLAAEGLALRFRELHALNVVAARIGTVVGRWERDTGVRETLSPVYQITRLQRRPAGAVAGARPAGLGEWAPSAIVPVTIWSALSPRMRNG